MYPHFAVIALGSNLANPAEQVRAALAELDVHPHIRLEKASSLYLTAPVGYDDQPDFVNAVCTVKTSLDGVALLAELNRIEAEFGRERTFRNAPRTLDLDIIDFDGIRSDDPHLTIRARMSAVSLCCLWPKFFRISSWASMAVRLIWLRLWAGRVFAC